jgi:uncharacterized protein
LILLLIYRMDFNEKEGEGNLGSLRGGRVGTLGSYHCGICMEEFSESEILKFCDGKHSFCQGCFSSYKEKAIANVGIEVDEDGEEHEEDYSINEDKLNTIPCPVCRKRIEMVDPGFTGMLTGNYLNGTKKWEISYEDGLREGFLLLWADNGVLYKKLTYVRGVKEGPCQTFRSHSHQNLMLPGDGSIVSEVNYIADVKEGEEREYYPYGHLKARRFYVKGLKEGHYVQYYNPVDRDGNEKKAEEGGMGGGGEQKIISESYYINGKLNGTSIRYWQNGDVETMSEYIDGKMHGVHKRWTKNGTLIEKVCYKMGMKNDETKIWHPNGQLKSRALYVDGSLHGVYQEWHDDGSIAKETTFVRGKQDGKTFCWYANGALYQEYNYVAGLIEGEWRRWWKNGMLQGLCHYVGGNLHGKVQRWSESGELIGESMYEHGKKV